MGKGRAPCCDKSKVKRGPWSPAEDLRLTNFIQKHGHPNWRSLPNQAGLLRCGKSCRLRWINYLRPDVKRGNFTPEEEQIIINLHNSFGNKWSKIASYLPGRTDNEIKNVWNTHLKKIVTKKVKKNYYLVSPSSNSTSLTSNKEVEESGIHSLEENNIKSTGTSVEESKETTNYDSPMTSCASNFSNSSQDQNGSSPKKDNEKIEIPFNSDINFWELLDSMDPSQSSITEQDDGNKDFNCYNSSENFDGDFECGKWLRFFENYELGLAGTENDYLSEEVDNMVQTTMQYEEMYLEPEIGPALDYFPIWRHGLL